MNSKPTFDEMEQHIIFQDGVIRDLRSRLNTHLIAAAPEMLEALQNVLRCAERDDVEKRRDMTGLNVHLTTRAVVAIREAITRATGRERGE